MELMEHKENQNKWNWMDTRRSRNKWTDGAQVEWNKWIRWSTRRIRTNGSDGAQGEVEQMELMEHKVNQEQMDLTEHKVVGANGTNGAQGEAGAGTDGSQEPGTNGTDGAQGEAGLTGAQGNQ
jgi:hypothetical protein